MSENASIHVWLPDTSHARGGTWIKGRGTADGEIKTATKDEAASLQESSMRTAAVLNGGAAVVPSSDLSSAPAADDIIKWTFSSGRKFFTAMAATSVVMPSGTTSNNILGWWVTINAGSPIAARDRLREALDTATGIEVAVYAAGATVDADENKGSFIVPNNAVFSLKSDDDITDVYVMPVAEAATAVGGSVLSVLVS